ncbi:NmrA family NAD(P)-binding protein [Tistrella bauzanensis]|uniref:NmrA family NAD(P)-binding protein n=1 Tax=Tistrella arctica TaxID=3133430 RepID=A0ABU9YQJ6_9PROT
MTVLVANANGKIGSAVVDALVAAGVPVRAGVRRPDAYGGSDRLKGVEAVAFDYGDPALMVHAVQGVEAVFSAAPYETLPTAEAGLAVAAAAAGVARIVKLSALGPDDQPPAAHAAAEMAVLNALPASVMLRPTFFMQNYATTHLAAIRDGGAFYEPAAQGRTAFVDARDIADMAVAGLTDPAHAGRIYSLTGPEALSRDEVAARIAVAAGRPVAYVAVDDAALRAALNGADPLLVELMSELMALVRAGGTERVHGDIPAVLGRPARDVATFARDHATVWR